MVCPRCGRDSTDGAAVCRRCGAPLAIPDEPAPGRLDAPLDVDRRNRETVRETPPSRPRKRDPRPEPAAGAPTLPPVRSEWTIGRPPRAPPEPAPPPRAPAAPPPRAPAAPPVKIPGRAAPPPRAVPPAAGPPPAAQPGWPAAPPASAAAPPPRGEPPPPPRPTPEPAARTGHPAPPPSALRPPDFFAPPYTPAPSSPRPRAPLREEPPGSDPFAFTDLPEDDPPELAQPPATREADEAFAELTARMRAGATPPPPVRGAAPPPLPPPPAPAPARHVAAVPSRPLPPTPPRPRRAAAPAPELPEAEVAPVEIHVRRAAPWRRAVAWMVDAVPFAVASAVLVAWVARQGPAGRAHGGGLEPLVDLVAREHLVAGSIAAALLLAHFSYATLAHALGGATLGKWLVRIRVVGPDGAPPSLTRSAVRSGLALLSLALLGLGLLLALFTRTGRALHDLVARTWVVEAP